MRSGPSARASDSRGQVAIGTRSQIAQRTRARMAGAWAAGMGRLDCVSEAGLGTAGDTSTSNTANPTASANPTWTLRGNIEAILPWPAREVNSTLVGYGRDGAPGALPKKLRGKSPVTAAGALGYNQLFIAVLGFLPVAVLGPLRGRGGIHSGVLS